MYHSRPRAGEPEFETYYFKSLRRIIGSGEVDEFMAGKDLFLKKAKHLARNVNVLIAALPADQTLMENVFGCDPVDFAVRSQEPKMLRAVIETLIDVKLFRENTDWGKMLANAAKVKSIETKVEAVKIITEHQLTAEGHAGKAIMAIELSVAGIGDATLTKMSTSSYPMRFETDQYQFEVANDGTTQRTKIGEATQTLDLLGLCELAVAEMGSRQEQQSAIATQQQADHEAERKVAIAKHVTETREAAAKRAPAEVAAELASVEKFDGAEQLVFAVREDPSTMFGVVVNLNPKEHWETTHSLVEKYPKEFHASLRAVGEQLSLSWVEGTKFAVHAADGVEEITAKLLAFGFVHDADFQTFIEAENLLTSIPKTKKSKSR